MQARDVYLCALAVVAATVAVVLLRDFCLWLMGLPTVSDWLRKNEDWFWWPAGLIMLGLLFLAFHLFWAPWSKRC